MLEIQKKLSNTFYAILSLPATAMGFGLAIQTIVLSWIMQTQYKLDIHEIGIVWAAGPIAGIIGQVVIGVISDKVWFWGGRRRPFILIGGVLAALMLFALPNLDYIQEVLGISSIIVIALIVALTFDLSINISFNPTRSIIADVTPDGVPRTKGYTWMQTISGFFGVMSGVIGTIFDNYFLIYFGIFLILAFSIIPIFLVEEPRKLSIEDDAIKEKSDHFQADWKELFKIYFAHSFSWLGVFTMFVFAVIFIQDRYMPTTDAEGGQIWAAANIVFQSVGFLLPLFVLEPISERIGRVKTHLIAVAIMALGYFLIAFVSQSPISFYIFMAIVGIGWASIVSLPFAIMSEKADKSRMGYFMGIFNLSVVLPQLIVSLVLGYFIQEAEDKNLIFIISGTTLAISALLWTFVKESKAAIVESN